MVAGCAGAVAAASPSGVNLSRVVEMWTAAIKAGRAGKEAALHAALGILSSPSPPSANAPTGVMPPSINPLRSSAWLVGKLRQFSSVVLCRTGRPVYTNAQVA